MSKILISVDIQPEYENVIDFDMEEYINFIKESEYDFIYYLYNGHDTLGMCTEEELKYWIFEKLDYDEDKMYFIDTFYFYDKGYAFFRYCMDENIEYTSIVDFVKFLDKNEIRDARDLTKKQWISFIKEYGHKNIRELMEHTDECFFVPDLMDVLKGLRGNIDVCGGGVDACLKEVVLALDALDKNYNVLNKWTY